MENRIQLSIPQPCSEKWENFTPTNTGGFCGSCQKTIIDFTKMTDAEVMQFLKTKPIHACGRFRSDQLKEYRDIPIYSIKPSRMFLRAGLLSVFLALISKPIYAQTVAEPVKKEVVSNVNYGTRPFVLTGVVVDEENLPIPGVNVVRKWSVVGTVTDANGRFEIQATEGDEFTFSFIGYETQPYIFKLAKDESITVTLLADVTVLGGLMPVMMGAVATSDPEPPKQSRSWFAAIKNWF